MGRRTLTLYLSLPLYYSAIAYFLLHGSLDYWRPFVALCAIPCWIALIAGYMVVPESARWLASQGRHEEAATVMKQVASVNGTLEKLQHVTKVVSDGGEDEEEEAGLLDLLQAPWRNLMAVLWMVWFLFGFGYYGTIVTITHVFAAADEVAVTAEEAIADGDTSMILGAYDFDFRAIFWSAAAEFVGISLAIAVVDRWGRIRSQAGAYLVAGVAISLLCGLASAGSMPRVVLVGLAFVARSMEMAGTCLTWVSTAELLTTQIRGTGHSTSNATARLGAMLCQYVIVGGENSHGGDSASSLRMVAMVMLAVHALLVVGVFQLPETNGKEIGSTCPSVHHHNRDEKLSISTNAEQVDGSGKPLPTSPYANAESAQVV